MTRVREGDGESGHELCITAVRYDVHTGRLGILYESGVVLIGTGLYGVTLAGALWDYLLGCFSLFETGVFSPIISVPVCALVMMPTRCTTELIRLMHDIDFTRHMPIAIDVAIGVGKARVIYKPLPCKLPWMVAQNCSHARACTTVRS